MRINVDLQVKDTPGQLVAALNPIAEHGGNLVSIIHFREKKVDGGRLIVHVVFDVESKVLLDKIVEELKARDIGIAKLGEVFEKKIIEVLLVGNVIEVDLKDMIKEVERAGDIKVSNVALSMPSHSKESCALITIEAVGDASVKSVWKKIGALSKAKNLLAISGID